MSTTKKYAAINNLFNILYKIKIYVIVTSIRN